MTLTLFFLALLLLVSTAIWIEIRKAREKEHQQMQETEERAAKDSEGLDTAIGEWLATLEPPALAKQTKRLGAARRLRTVLIGKLLRQRILC